MKKTSNPIVFFGSGPVAAKSLELLHQDFLIEAVITKPRPAHHKGDVPVLHVAEKMRIPVFTANNRAELDELFTKNTLNARVAVLVDFGIIISQKVIDYFPLGIVNSHFSLLPAWRGADPITFAVLNGDKQTGVSLMLLVEAMDEGPLLAQAPVDLDSDITTPELTDALIDVSYAVIREMLPLYITGSICPAPQPDREASYSRRLNKEDGIIDWIKPAGVLEREIRAFAGWPKSRCRFGHLEVIIIKAHVTDASGKPGTTTVLNKLPVVYCGTKALVLDRLKPANKKEMDGKAFLAGYKNVFLGS